MHETNNRNFDMGVKTTSCPEKSQRKESTMQQEADLLFRHKANDNQRPQRRQYTSKACNECRRRRAKCDGASPFCSRCAQRGIACQYRAEEDRRRPAARSYAEMLRGRIDLLERVIRLNSVDFDASIAVLKTRERSRKLGDESPLSSDEALDGDANSSPAICEEPSESFSGMLSSDKALNFERDGEIRYFGPTSGRLNFGSRDCNTTYRTKVSDTSNPLAAELSHVRAQVNRSFSSDDHDTISEQLKLHLIDLYFEWYQPWCQMVDEHLFRESRASHGRFHSPLLEHCILAVGARFSDVPELRSNPSDPNTAGLLLFDKADLKWPTITTIQSLNLLSILHVAVGADAAGWLRQGMAIRLALDMGLNLDAASLRGSNLLTTEEIELRRQIYWALYCDDKLYAIYTGRVCTMLTDRQFSHVKHLFSYRLFVLIARTLN
ncbi:hypothetical protein UA08_02057 [Talaromyces atroroseus]|uniref:Zn(2)-C6 fungal-type domain-containing protein n=1 Tax=Talaromyces atroroseus TaxID=1441469 RepID=A0A1Q5QCF0_TALAT|nr:hypothetical protein UA08_02057 [Talaromyces atroroseus]OKL63508.1 hypothetical protein UA08_02057 [Talaromyces atroroseus]